MEARASVIQAVLETSEYLHAQPLAKFFHDLGFVVDWDFDRRTGLHWYEIRDEHKLLVQIDSWAPLVEVISDLPRLAGLGPDIAPNYAPGSPEWQVRGPKANLERVAARIRAREFGTSG